MFPHSLHVVARLIGSHPSAGLLLHSMKPGLHVFTQLPVAHEGVVFARPEHGTPHAPQSVSVRVDTHMTPAPESQSMRPIEPSQPVA